MTMDRRRGITLVEVVASAALLTVLLAVLAHVLVIVAMQRRSGNRRLLAVEEVANVMERIALRQYDELQADQPPEIPLSDEALRSLPGAALTIDVSPEGTQPPLGKRVTVQLTWENRSGQTNRPVRLSAWRYRRAAADAAGGQGR
jgi:type II secretory pathway pseudopilin PulG